MGSKDGEEQCNTETEEGTVARQKKRSRRVSFAAEITSVHVFNRDDECETPPESKPSSDCDTPQLGLPDAPVLRFLKDLGDTTDDDDDDNGIENEDDDVHQRKSFLRPFQSPSPGSTIGSASSNDDNFFGPVSASFIRPGRFSDSAASDENHDITMDSTAFSMHFRSLARSDSGGELKTPTGVRLAFDEKTPTQNSNPDNVGSSMVLTVAKKPNSQSSDKASAGADSNEMSLVGENPNRYDYGRLSPQLDALLAEGNRDLHVVSFSDLVNSPKSPSYLNKVRNTGSGAMDLKDNGDIDGNNIDTHEASAKKVPVAHMELSETNAGFMAAPIDQITSDSSPDTNDGPATNASSDHQIRTPNQPAKAMTFGEMKEFTRDAHGLSRSKVEFSALNSGTLSNLDNKIVQSDFLMQHECGHLSSDEGWVKESSPKDGTYKNSNIDQNVDQRYRSPLAGSVHLLSAKRQQQFLDNANSPRNSWAVTPSKNHHGSFLSNDHMRHGDSESSIQKSISKLKILEASSYGSLRDGIGGSKLRSLDYLSATPPLNVILEENSKDPQHKHLDVPIDSLEEHLGSVAQKDGILTPKNEGNLSQTDETTGFLKDGKSLHHMSMGILQMDETTTPMAVALSPTQFTWSGHKVLQHNFTTEDTRDGTLVSSGTDSPLGKIILDCAREKKTSSTPDKLVSSRMKRLEKKLLASPEYHGSLSRDLKQQDQHNKFSFGSGQDGSTIENFAINSHSSATANKLDSPHLERRGQSSTPFIEIKHSKEFSQVTRMNDKEINLHDLQNESGALMDFETPSRDMDTLNHQSPSPEKNLQTGEESTRLKNELPGGGIKASSFHSPSLYAHRSTIESPFGKKSDIQTMVEKPSRALPQKKPTQSPSKKEPYNASHVDNFLHFVGKGISSPQANQFTNVHGSGDCYQGLHISQTQFSKQDVENSPGQKRRSEELVLKDVDNELVSIQRSPKIHKGGGRDSRSLLELSDRSNKHTERMGDYTPLTDWADIFSKFSEDTKQILSPLIDNLNLRAISLLEDILLDLQKVRAHEMFFSEIQSQKILDHASNLTHKRAAETRFLLSKMAYEQAKQQLMCVKREKLLERVQLLSSGIQESQMLKMNSFQRLSLPGARDAQVDDGGHQSCSVNFEGKIEDAYDKVSAMRQEIEASDRKIKNLTKSLQSSCKMKGKPSCAETILLVTDHLNRRTCCRFIRQDLQFWEVDEFENRNYPHSFVLCYRNFMFQRFSLNASPLSSIIISNKLNDTKIVKNFPNMDACTAFAFVIDVETTKKHVGPRSLAQETQMTSSLLSNLLDVVEEVQLARLELRNLSKTSFHSPSVGQLDLHLCFIDLKSGRKVTLILDVTCLKCGIYPSELLPSQIQAAATGTHEIRGAVENLRAGYPRILRLSRCVSHVIHASSG
ncbi:uncharacterized protein LOC117926727 isoform X2 [Vitis riparia]|uniref:uncharacterized protein LOC117926727 isoform X2 n=1 Tax=Vitis riparia TaxID=96939 RepID=UPI00155A36E9|nr:uncharacterized protein LOC117926727 isoform X2 [Vitis riparia]